MDACRDLGLQDQCEELILTLPVHWLLICMLNPILKSSNKGNRRVIRNK